MIRTSTDDKTYTQKDFSPSPQSLAIISNPRLLQEIGDLNLAEVRNRTIQVFGALAYGITHPTKLRGYQLPTGSAIAENIEGSIEIPNPSATRRP